MTYEQALKDWKYLWNIAPADDMTGGYVDQDDLKKLLLNPCKKTAKDCLVSQITYWMQAGPDQFEVNSTFEELAEQLPEIKAIKKRHNIPLVMW